MFNKQITIRNNTIAPGQAYIIAEMACAHDGDFDNAKALIDIAKTAGCDAVQFQLFDTDNNVVHSHKIYSLLKKIQFEKKQWEDLLAHARDIDITVFACAYDKPSLDLAIELEVDGIKFNSADLNYAEMLETVSKSGIPFTLGTGASTTEEIERALRIVREHGGKDVVLMHGVQSFPTQVENANISRIRSLVNTYDTLVGYADHTSGDNPFSINIDLLALGAGACVFEKHYTIDRNLKGTDYQASLNPEELKEYVSQMHAAVQALGDGDLDRPLTKEEIEYRTFQKKKIVAARAIKKDQVIKREDLQLLRTESTNGCDASILEKVVGKRASEDIANQAVINAEDIY